MYGDSSTAPTLPPPGPVMPGKGDAGPGVSPQHASVSELPASSQMISSSPFFLNASEPVIFGTQVSRKASMSSSAAAPLVWLVQGKSWPSLQRFGVMKANFAVFVADDRSVARPVSWRGAAAAIAAVGDPVATT